MTDSTPNRGFSIEPSEKYLVALYRRSTSDTRRVVGRLLSATAKDCPEKYEINMETITDGSGVLNDTQLAILFYFKNIDVETQASIFDVLKFLFDVSPFFSNGDGVHTQDSFDESERG